MRKLFIVVLLLLVITIAWTRQRTRHFIGHHDWDNATWVSVAENYQRYGLIDTQLAQIVNTYPTSHDDRVINQRHPPGISLITWVAIETLGSSEFAARLPPIFASLIATALLFTLARRLFDTDTAILSLFFFSFTPVMIYFSAKIGHEQFTLPLMISTLILYQQHPTASQHQLPLFGLGFIGGTISWAWYLFAGLLSLHAWNYRRLKPIQGLIIGTVCGAIALTLVGLWQNPDYFTTLWDAMLARSTTSSKSIPTITLKAWLLIVGTRLLWMPTPIVTFFATVALWMQSRGRLHSMIEFTLLAIPAGVTIIYDLVFWNGTYIHDYYLYYLFAPLSVWAAVGFKSILYAYGHPPKPTWRLLFGVLLVLFLVGSYRWSLALYTEDTATQRHDWGIAAHQATVPEEIVVSNLPYLGPHIGYYAQRRVLYEQTPEIVMNPDRPLEWGFYIYCFEEGEPAPPWLADYIYSVDIESFCYLVDLHSEGR